MSSDNIRWERASQILALNLEDFLKYFSIEFHRCGNRYSFPCPLHEGDNQSGAAVYNNKNHITFNCFTNCPRDHSKNGIHFIKGLLSRSGEASLGEAVDFIYKFVDEKAPASPLIKIPEKDTFLKVFGDEEKTIGSRPTREQIRSKLKIPSAYFLGRGFDLKTLDLYDVGNCDDKYKKFYNRAVVPCYSVDGISYEGATSRSIFEECPKCKYHHAINKMCPVSEYEMWKCEKWLHSDIHSSKMLYNLWAAKDSIRQSHKVVLVEGVMDCLKLVSLGIKNVVALYGNYLKPGQTELLDSCGVMDLIVMLDNDKAGVKGCQDIKKRYGRMYRLYFPRYEGKDAGEMNSDQITSEIKPLLSQLEG